MRRSEANSGGAEAGEAAASSAAGGGLGADVSSVCSCKQPKKKKKPYNLWTCQQSSKGHKNVYVPKQSLSAFEVRQSISFPALQLLSQAVCNIPTAHCCYFTFHKGIVPLLMLVYTRGFPGNGVIDRG